jgi:hypothetical protein
MGSAQRSHKAWVRKHQPSYWEVWFGKKKKDKKNGCNADSVRAQHGSPAHGHYQGSEYQLCYDEGENRIRRS